MLRDQYLALPRVSDFIDWLASNLDHVSLFAHSYYERRQKVTKTFLNLTDANAQYFWKHKGALGTPSGACLTSSHAALETLCDALQTGINTANDTSTLDASMRVMEWGGVSAGNVRWLTVNAKRLVRTLASTTAALTSGDLANPVLTRELRFNAGMTKIYSLLVNDFIIYDSRVAAALGWIVVKYCQARSLPVLPAELAFPWAPAKEAPNAARPKNRDPSQSPYHFPRLVAGELHAVWNLKASWILAEVLARAPASYFNGTSPIPALRRLEAALFMIGYDLPVEHSAGGAAVHTYDAVGDDWTECYTAAKGKRFHYRIEAGGIRLHDRRFFPTTIINKTLNILREQFGNRSFPLANSATAVRSGKARPGIGRAYFDATAKTGNPPATSALAAVLHELGVLNHQSGSREPWSINASEFADQAEIDVSPLFARVFELNDSL